MTTLVTGATGLLGNNIARALLARGESVRVLVRSTADGRPLQGLKAEVAPGDIQSLQDVQRACSDVKFVIHSAAWVGIGWSQLDLARAVNVDGTRNVCQAAREAGARLIHVSTVDTLPPGAKHQPASEDSVGQKVPCTYVVTKREAERVVDDEIRNGLDAVIVHPGFMLGPNDWKPSSGRMLLEVVQGFAAVTPTGGCSACDVRDVTEAILRARDIGRTGRHYILAGHNISYFDLWSKFRKVVGRGKPPIMRAGPLMRIIGGWIGDVRHKIQGREPVVNSAAVRMSSLFHYYSSARAEHELDYRIRPLDETIRDTWQWFVEHKYC